MLREVDWSVLSRANKEYEEKGEGRVKGREGDERTKQRCRKFGSHGWGWHNSNLFSKPVN